MENKDNVGMQGIFEVTVRDRYGNIKEKTVEHNTIMDAGLPELVKLMGALPGASAVTLIAVGSGTTSESRGQTALSNELTDGGFARATATLSPATYTGYVTNSALLFEHTFTATDSRTVAEVGLFNGNNVMFARKKLTTAKPLDLDETITFKYYYVFGDAV
jgi:hypothetical protein